MFNQTILIGNLGKDPNQTNQDTDKPQVHASLATTESWQKDGEWQEKTSWHSIMAYGAAAVKFLTLTKGQRILVVGELNYFPDKDDSTRQGNAFVKVLRPPKNLSRTASSEEAKDNIPF